MLGRAAAVTMMMMAVGVAVGGSGCGVGTRDGSAGAELLAAPPEGAGLQLGLHAPAGLTQDTRLCRLVVLPGGQGLDVETFEHALSEGATALRISHTDLSIEDAWAHPERVDCAELEGLAGATVYASGEPDGVVELPAGVALHFAPHEVVLLEARFAPAPAAGEAVDAVALNLWLTSTPPARRTATLPADVGPVAADAGE